MAPWRRRDLPLGPRAATLFFLLWVGSQVAIPLYLLTRPRPARFGWQMYAAGATELRLEVIDEGGDSRPLTAEAWVLRMRRDLPLVELLPPHLCRVLPDAAAIRVREAQGLARRYPCP